MNTRMRIAFGCYLAGTLIVTAFGIVYLFRSEFMPYHAVAVGRGWEAFDPAVQVLLLALMRAVASGCLAVAVLQIVLLLVPFRQGATWARWTMTGAGLLMCAGSLYAMLLVKLNTPANPPLFGPILGAVLLLLGLWQSRERGRA